MAAKLNSLILQKNTKIDFSANIYRQLSTLELVRLITLLKPSCRMTFSANAADDYYFSSASSIEKLINQKISDGESF